ncbi:MAG: HAD family hydrolase [Clostridiales bacterium]|nr:HAD family hydrolase [Clostridiales bacterium]
MSKLVIFDLDGTLLDTISDITYNLNLMLKDFGYPEQSVEDTKPRVGTGARNLVKFSIDATLTEDELSSRLARFSEYYATTPNIRTKLFEGMDVVLKTLKERGYKIAIVTNKPQRATTSVYNEHLSNFNFDAVIGKSETFKHKPDPESTNYLIEKLKVNKQDVYFVGDGETDVMTAKNAGVKAIAVLWGYRTYQNLKDAGAEVFASKPLDLLEKII